ncbi:MAG TPA: hypothetical protein PK335_04305 [Draconibacterium sp.]|nr:hypothetical protein [Draconibacterium sp.]
MGIERDFLMRQIMQLFNVLQRILGLRIKGDREEAEEQIRYFYKILKWENDIRKLTIEELIDYVHNKKKLTNEQTELLAYVLKEQGELADQEDERLDFFRKAYFLLNEVERESTVFSMDRQMKLGELKAYLN